LHFLFAIYLLSKELIAPMPEMSSEETKQLAKAIAEANKEIAELTEEEKSLNKQTKEVTKAFAGLRHSNVDVIKEFAKLGDTTSSVIDQFKNFGTAVEGLTSNIGKANMLNKAADKLLANSQELANVLDKARGSYVMATGDVLGYYDSMNTSMHNASNSITKFGVDVSAATVSVRSALPMMTEDFDNLSEASKKNFEQVVTTVALMKELGVGTEQATANINAYSNSLLLNNGAMGGFTARAETAADAVGKTTLELSNMGYTLSEATSMMNQASDTTLVFGKEALTELAAISKTTTIALADLLAVSSNFDTFEKAGEQVGKLNALLGADYLGTTEMMFAAPAEQVEMISGAFEKAGLTASSLTNMSDAEQKFTLMTIQSTLGLKNRGDALNFLKADEIGRAEIMAKQAEQQEKNANTQERLNELLIQSMPAIEQLSNLFKSFFSMLEPAFTVLNFVMNGIGEAFTEIFGPMKQWSDLTKGIVGTIELVILAFGSYMLTAKTAAAASTTLTLAQNALGGASSLLAPAITPVGPAVKGLGGAAATSWPQILALGGAIFLVGAGIGVAAYGLSYMVAAFKGLGGGAAAAATVAIIGFTVAIGFLMYFLFSLTAGPQGILVAAAIGILLSIGAAAYMIGLGVGLAAAGIATLAGSIAKLADVGDALASIKALATALDELVGKTIRINVEVTGDVDALKAAAKLTTAANSSSTSASTGYNTAGAASAGAPVEREIGISIAAINIKFDETTTFKGTVEKIIEGYFKTDNAGYRRVLEIKKP